MKKGMRLFTVAFVLALLCSIFALTAYAKDLEPCRLCGGKGDYHCVSCGNTGTVTCHVCNGTGVWNCPGEDGKGKCDNGYYTCPSCHGDTYIRNGDGEIPIDAQPGTCGTCSGKGKLECWTCHSTPTRACDGCNGTGKEECQVETCKVSRAYGWKCPDCKGTGYILVGNPMLPKENNDGIRNVPTKGDYIVTNDKTWAGYTYGGGSGTGEQPVVTVPVTTEPITTEPITTNPVTTEPVTTEPVTTEPVTTEPVTTEPVTTEPVTTEPITTEPVTTEPPKSDDPPVQPGTDTPQADLSLVPDNRDSDFDIPIPEDSGHPASASVGVEIDKMTDTEQQYFADLPDENLAQVLTNVRTIVATAEPGRSDSETDELLNALAVQNGYESTQDGRILPLYFEGHQEIGFPVRVTVSIEKGVLDGGADLYVYHVAEDGEIESLGRAEYSTYEDGSIESVSFYTSSFSTFFTSAKELDLNIQTDKTDPNLKIGNNSESNGDKSFIPFLAGVIAAAVIAALAIVTIILVKKRKTNM